MESNKTHKDKEVYLAQWLDGKISDETLKEYVSEEDFLIYKKMQSGLLIMEELEKPLASSFNAVQQKIQQQKRTKFRRQTYRWSISIAASLVLFFGLYSSINVQSTTIETFFAHQKEIVLLDGSEVIMNSNSEISYQEREWNLKRDVNLKGEAFFKVKKGSSFTVLTDQGTVTVLGTKFNVNASDDFFEVICYEGKVKVNINKEDYFLTPNQAIRRINGNTIERWDSKSISPTWINGESSFKSVPLKYVIKALEKQYNLKFITTKIDDSLIFTGSFSHKNIEIALASVFKTMNISYSKKDKSVYELNHDK